MSYRTVLGINASQDILKMPAPVARYALAQLRNLERDPTLLSERSHFPFREKCQLFTFDYDWSGQRYFFNVLFQYNADEQTLEIHDIPWQVVSDWWEDSEDDGPVDEIF